MHPTHTIGDKIALKVLVLYNSERILVLIAPHTDIGTRSTPQQRQIKGILFA